MAGAHLSVVDRGLQRLVDGGHVVWKVPLYVGHRDNPVSSVGAVAVVLVTRRL